jgi:tRNA (guanine-N7-)-methyltransferase
MNINFKKIRTYIKRESRLTTSQRFALENYWMQFGLTPETGLINFEEVFSRQAPKILEIGFGMGESLFTIAKTMPDHDFIGIEVHRPGIGALLTKLEKEAITNVRVYNADAIEILSRCIPDNSLEKILIFFPDPWPKRRHHKRRLIQKEFMGLLHSKLKSRGELHLATDWEEYALQMMKVISMMKEFKNVNGDGQFSSRSVYRVLTKFEKRGEKLGHRIWDLFFVKI